MLTDTTLIQKTLNGETEAFGLLVRRYQNRIYALVLNYIGNFADAQDVTQETFVEAYRNISRLRETEKFVHWLSSIAVNRCKMFLRKHRNAPLLNDETAHQMVENMPVDRNSNPTTQLEREESRQNVMRILQRLPETYRLAFTLRYMDLLSVQEIADFLGISVSAVKVRLHRARQRLKEEIIHMVQDDFERNQLPPEFTQKVIDEAIRKSGEHISAEEYDAALAELDKVLAIRPDYAPAYESLGWLYAYRAELEDGEEREAHLDKAIAYYTKSLELDEKNLNTRRLLGIAYRIRGDMDASIATHQQNIEIAPDKAWTHGQLAFTYIKKSEKLLEAALAECRREIELATDDETAASAHSGLGGAYYRLHDYKKAEAELLEALRLCEIAEPTDQEVIWSILSESHHFLALITLESRRPVEEVLEHLEAAIQYCRPDRNRQELLEALRSDRLNLFESIRNELQALLARYETDGKKASQ